MGMSMNKYRIKCKTCKTCKTEKSQHFKEAYKLWSGNEWEWKLPNGDLNHPATSEDPIIVAFYQGFRSAKTSTKKFDRLIDEIPELRVKLSKIEKELAEYKNFFNRVE